MKQIQPDLWETQVERPAPGLTTHAYLLIRDGGNVLFYNTGCPHGIEPMAELGGVAYQYLSHRDELGDSLKLIRERFAAKLGGHVSERADFARIRPPDILFDVREVHLGDIEVIPTPGHSPGSTCFLVRSPHGKTYLFTGDTFYLSESVAWQPGYIPGISDRDALGASLEVLRELEPEVVLSSAFAGGAGFQALDPGQWPGHVDRAIRQLRGGASPAGE